MSRYICIHGHFYQPPRENPWLEEIEYQDSAYPYHDWNERITAECYAPNSASRILGDDRKIQNIVNNYSNISFNFGPTLLSWMQDHEPDFYKNILQADKESQEKFSGHGSAIAQVYNHMIMPLANTADKRTQIYWGIKDFEHRFKRKPEGMWLAETAVNIETLDILSEFGIKFTILAPHQAEKVRKIGDDKWRSAKGGKVETQTAYLCNLPSGRTINLFFYDGPVSQELAFQNLLKSGETFANRLLGVFTKGQDQDRLVHIATDGETYGHHQNFGDMALAFCLHHIESKNLAKITIYGEYLDKFPPQNEVQIMENTSWSCAHGIDRWWTDCGCNSGGNPGWHQKWREPLRNALDWLRDACAPLYEQHMREFTDDPWQIRNNFIEVVLDRSAKSTERFLKKNTKRELQHAEKIKVLKLLELQRHAMLMYTSCGWFFDEISGIETTQILQYAARVIQLAQEVFQQNFDENFKNILKKAPSNIDEHKNGEVIYGKFAESATIDLLRVGAHYAVASLFKEHKDETRVYCYTVYHEAYERKEAGTQTIVLGQAKIRSEITLEEENISFAVVHLGSHSLNGGVRYRMGGNAFKVMSQEIKKAFSKSDIPEVIRLMGHHFGSNNYSLKHLFKDEQKHLFEQVIGSALDNIESHFRQIYEQHYPLMQAKDDLQISPPKALATSIEFVLNRDLIGSLNKDKVDIDSLGRIVEEVKRWSFEIDKPTLNFVVSKKINILMRKFRHSPQSLNMLKLIEALMRTLSPLSLSLDLWQAQNYYFAISKDILNGNSKAKKKSGQFPSEWFEAFKRLGEYLKIQSQ